MKKNGLSPKTMVFFGYIKIISISYLGPTPIPFRLPDSAYYTHPNICRLVQIVPKTTTSIQFLIYLAKKKIPRRQEV